MLSRPRHSSPHINEWMVEGNETTLWYQTKDHFSKLTFTSYLVLKISIQGTSLVQWLRLRPSTAGGTGWIPGGVTKIPRASWCSQKKKRERGKFKTSLVAQRVRLHAPNAGGQGSIPGQRTGSHKPQLRVGMPQLKIPHATTMIQRSQINKYLNM